MTTFTLTVVVRPASRASAPAPNLTRTPTLAPAAARRGASTFDPEALAADLGAHPLRSGELTAGVAAADLADRDQALVADVAKLGGGRNDEQEDQQGGEE